ncbi:MAG: hypothetical protein M0R80_26210 [Proteobacteria bacterium]|nr:hypothetical protein [Pseudomonadota bacterium]
MSKKKVSAVVPDGPQSPIVRDAEYQITIVETGEVVTIRGRDAFLALPTLESKATAYAHLVEAIKKLSALKRELDVLMTAAAVSARPDPSKVVNIPTEVPGVTVELPSGLKDKTLSKGEVEAFANALLEYPEARNEIIEEIPNIKKVGVNKWRTIPGPVADLILKTYDPQPKTVEIKVKE